MRSVSTLFRHIVRHPITGVAAAQVLAWQAGVYALSTPAIWLLARTLSWDRPTRSAVTLSIPTVNVASYGVPVVLFALGDEALSIVMLLFVYGNMLHLLWVCISLQEADSGRSRRCRAYLNCP